MKTKTACTAALIVGLSLLHLPRAFAQGSLTPPPGPPAPTMKSLQEIWDKIDALETRAAALETQNTLLQSANSQLVRQVGLLAASTVNFAWVVSTVAPGREPSLAFGPNGQPAIAFTTGGPQIRFAQFDGTTWIVDDVPGAQGDSPSLAFGLDGYPAIAYSGPSARLHFARFDGTSWSVTMVAATGQAGYTPSLAFGPDGLPGIASQHGFGATNSLKYAAFTGSEWSFITVAAGDVGSYPSLAFGPDGQPAISFRVWPAPYNNGLVKLARLNAGVWTATTAANDQTSSSGLPTSLAFGPDGQPAIAFRNQVSQRLYVTRYSGSVSTPVTVTAGNTTSTLSLAFGPDGQPTLAYCSPAIDLLFARYTGSLDGPAWVSTVADSAGEAGYNPSLAFGPDGQPAIAYWEIDSSFTAYIKFARKGVFKPL